MKRSDTSYRSMSIFFLKYLYILIYYLFKLEPMFHNKIPRVFMCNGYCVITHFSVIFVVISFMMISFGKGDYSSTKINHSLHMMVDKLPSTGLDSIDNISDNDEHHKIILLMPEMVHSANAKKVHPKVQHSKVIPVVHSGKVIHAHHHHHHNNVDHKHSHVAKVKHQHKHVGDGDHKHHHHGIGVVTHKYETKPLHNHKQKGKVPHKHDYSLNGVVNHHNAYYESPKQLHSKWHTLPYRLFIENTGIHDKNEVNNFIHGHEEKNNRHDSYIPIAQFTNAPIGLSEEDFKKIMRTNMKPQSDFLNEYSNEMVGHTGSEVNDGFVSNHENAVESITNPLMESLEQGTACGNFKTSSHENIISCNHFGESNNIPLAMKQYETRASFTSPQKNNVLAYSNAYHYQK